METVRNSLYRCTRNLPYTSEACPGRRDLSARNGNYVQATSGDDALDKMAAKYPEDIVAYGNKELAFTVQLWTHQNRKVA